MVPIALARIGPDATRGIPALVEALRDESWIVRLYAARALQQIDPGAAEKSAVPALRDLLDHENSDARLEAVNALQNPGIW
jgi:HEAT repeat protein